MVLCGGSAIDRRRKMAQTMGLMKIILLDLHQIF